MAAGSTYTPIATTTLTSNNTAITFSSISGSYTDLVVIVSYASTANDNSLYMKVGNGSIDTGTNYSTTVLSGNGSATASGRITSTANGIWLNGWAYGCSSSITTPSIAIVNLQNYSNTTTYKSVLTRADNRRDDGNGGTDLSVGLWRSTSAINTISITFISGSLLTGSIASLYGITAA